MASIEREIGIPVVEILPVENNNMAIPSLVLAVTGSTLPFTGLPVFPVKTMGLLYIFIHLLVALKA
jgi:hypothetical protein